MDKIYGTIMDDTPLTIEERERRATAYRAKVHRRELHKQRRRDRRMEALNNILHRVFFALAVLLAVLVCTGYAGGVVR